MGRIAKEHPCPRCGRAAYRLRNGCCAECKKPKQEPSKRVFKIKTCPGCGREVKKLGGVVCGKCRQNLMPAQLEAMQAAAAPTEVPRERAATLGLWEREGRLVEVTECEADEDGVMLVTYHAVGAPLYTTQQDFLSKYRKQ